RGDGQRDDPGRRRPLRALRFAARSRARGPRGPRGRERDPDGTGDARLGRRAHEPRGDRRAPRKGWLPRARSRLARNSNVPAAVREGMAHAGTVNLMDAEPQEAQRLATEARDRVRFEEDALALSDQVYRVARHLAN